MFKSRGFTFLEMLVVFSVIGILTGGGFASFVTYSKKQVLDQAVQDLKTGIDQAKFNAVSRVKPPAGTGCDNVPLSSYRLRVCASNVPCGTGTDLYETDAGCVVGGATQWTTSILASKKRPGTLAAPVSGCAMQFSVLSGIVAPCTIVLTDGSASKTICVDGGGNTSVLDGSSTCGQAYLPTTPTPTTGAIPTLVPLPTAVPNPPSIISEASSPNNASSIISEYLRYTVNPNGGATSTTYRYSTSSGTCSSLGSTFAGDANLTGTTNNSPPQKNLPGLIGNTVYNYCVTADNTSSGGGLTQGVGGNNTTDNFLTLPGVPTSPSATGVSATQINLSWVQPNGGATGYYAYKCTGNGCTSTASFIYVGTGTSIADTTGISCGTTYGYSFFSTNSIGNSAQSAWVYGTTSACCPTRDTNCSQYCSGNNLVFQCANGSCGTYVVSNTACTYGCTTISGSGFCNAAPTATPTPSCTNGYLDNDYDGYGTSYGCYSSGHIVATGGDCYDGNANAYPGQTAYLPTNRGDGSFDYNCDGATQYQISSSYYYCAGSLSTYPYSTSYNSSTGYNACSSPGSYSTGVNPVTLCNSLGYAIPPCGTYPTYWNGYYMIYANSCFSFLGYAVGGTQQSCH